MAGEQTTSCLDVLNKCGVAVEKLQKVNEQQNDLIAQQQKIIVDQKLILDEGRVWYKDGFTMVIIGLAAGILIEGIIIR